MASLESSESADSTQTSTPEYRTMQMCYVKLIDLLKSSINTVGDALFAEGHISKDVKEKLGMEFMTPTEKARKVVDCLMNRVKHRPSVYNEFVMILEKQGPWTKMTVDELNTCYQSLTEQVNPTQAASATEKSTHTSSTSSTPSQLTSETNYMVTHSDKTLIHPISTGEPVEKVICSSSTRTSDIAHDESYGFRCPHCALCSVDVFLSAKGCPNASDKDPQLFPFLDTTKLSEGDKINLEHRLRSETKKMILSFADLTCTMSISLEHREVKVKVLAASLLTLGAFKSGVAKKSLLEEDETSIRQASCIADIFLILTNYISYFNYEIIAHLVKVLGTENDRANLDRYVTAFNAFCRRSVFEVPSRVFGSATTSSSKFSKFAVKYSKDASENARCTMETAKQLQGKIADLFDITPCALQLVSIVKGCMQLQFVLPAFIAKQVFPLSSSQQETLRTLGIRVVGEPEVSNEDNPQNERQEKSTHKSSTSSNDALSSKVIEPIPRTEDIKLPAFQVHPSNEPPGEVGEVVDSSFLNAVRSSDSQHPYKQLLVGKIGEEKTSSEKFVEELEGETATGGGSAANVEWSTQSGKHNYGASGERDVLFIVSDSPSRNPDVVPRISRGELTDDERRKLENQGVPRNCHHDDLSIIKARYGLHSRSKIVGVESGDSGRELTREDVKKQIESLMNNTDKAGVVIYYIGHGKKMTGDWCFSDGFITLREILDLYMSNQHFRGRVLYIISDCSYSGSWVKECMKFMDEQGVGPCGHAAKEKGKLVKVLASCLSNEIPMELAFSTHCAQNDKNLGTVLYTIDLRSKEIHEGQHPSGLDFTQVQCNNKIDEPCTMAPGSTWQRWSAGRRLVVVRGTDKGRPAWHYVQLVDDEDTIAAFHKKIKEDGSLNVLNYGKYIKSGWGQDSSNEVQEQMQCTYTIDYNYKAK